MTIRVRDKARPGDTSHDLDLGPAHAQRTPFRAMRLELDDAIASAAVRGHAIKASR